MTISSGEMKCLFRSFAIFKLGYLFFWGGFICFFVTKLYKFFMYSAHKYLIRPTLLPLFSGLSSFRFLEVVLLCTVVLKFWWNPIYLFSSVTCALNVVSNKALFNPFSQIFPPVFSLEAFKLLIVAFRWNFFFFGYVSVLC